MMNTHIPKLRAALLLTLVSMIFNVGAVIAPREEAVQHQASPHLQINPTLTLNPSFGPIRQKITAFGEGWLPGTQITLAAVDWITRFELGGERVDGDGRFEIEFFMPTHMAGRPNIVVIARTVIGTAEEGQASVEAVFGLVAPIAEPETSTAPTTPASTTPAEEAAMTAEEMAICLAQSNQANASFSPVLQPILASAPVCNPGAWSGCGGASCSAQFVSQCTSQGIWGECQWDPGSCIDDTDVDDKEDDDGDKDDEDNDGENDDAD